jgi:(1->4)-alpha-D-glucan 1-alpha-D-glucosylmutase
MIPRATLRLQFHRDFPFAEAARHVDWFAGLGVSHIYASPLAVARPGSTHGYDVIDPTRINPELGGEGGLRALASALRAKDLGLILDIVPNHMAADPGNAWWCDVLRHGRASPYAAWFDIDWEDPVAGGKLLLPVLGRPLDEAIAAGELTLGADGQGRPALRYFDNVYPLADDSVGGRGSLANLLARQHYRLAPWRVAGDRINWRRFFDINELACLRMEEPAAFEAVHALPLRLFAEGVVDGLRIDHVDGLTDPAAYCRALRARLDALSQAHGRPRAWLVVEKILLKEESLNVDWGCDGTTGYDFMNDVSALQHDGVGEALLARAWAALSGRSPTFDPEERAARREIVARSFSAQLDACAAAFQTVLADSVPRPALRRLLVEFLAHFPVYRTYGAAAGLSARDAAILRDVADRASRSCLASDRWAVAPLLAAMLAPPVEGGSHWARALARFQQLSAPVAAKSVEDTAFYRYGRLLSRNDVGFDVETFALEPDAFHAHVLARQSGHPHAMLATATHDHKRGEDVRARLAVLSARATDWTALLPHWLADAGPLRVQAGDGLIPTAGDVAMLLQMLVGAWPLDLDPADAPGRKAFAERLADWQQKALREAKLRSDWAAVDQTYEAAARAFTRRLVADAELPDLLAAIVAFTGRIAPAGAVNGLAQTLLKLTVPGVPDLYQGTDLWDFSLVDPDNRRPVDFAARTARTDAPLAELTADWRDGRLKQALIRRTLALRRRAPRLFAEGDYRPVRIEGEARRTVLAFVRRAEPDWMLVVVPRLLAGLAGQVGAMGGLALAPGAWRGTDLLLDELPPVLPVYDWLGGGVVERFDRRPKVDLLCGTLPLALVSSVVPTWADC